MEHPQIPVTKMSGTRPLWDSGFKKELQTTDSDYKGYIPFRIPLHFSRIIEELLFAALLFILPVKTDRSPVS
jgi:hypothetical protein